MSDSMSGASTGSLLVEAARLTWDAYRSQADYQEDKLPTGNAVERGWQPLALPTAPGGVQEVTFGDLLPGLLPPEYAGLSTGAHFYTGELEGKQTLAIAFRGTDEGTAELAFQAAPLPPNPAGASFGWDLYYLAHAQAVAAALTLAATPGSGIEQILFAGHSLGGVVTELTAERLFAANFAALAPATIFATFGSPGSTAPGPGQPTPSGLNLLNFVHTDDFVALLPELSPLLAATGAAREGVTHLVDRPEGTLPDFAPGDLDTPEEILATGTDPASLVEHRDLLYVETAQLLDDNEHLAGFTPTQLADPLRWLEVPIDHIQIGSDGRDRLVGTAERDLLIGKDGNDRLEGRAGDDGLSGGKGNDRLYGGAGNDRLDGGAGDNHLDGGAGNDVYLVKNEVGEDGTLRGDLVGFNSYRDTGGYDSIQAVANKTGATYIGLTDFSSSNGIEEIVGVDQHGYATRIVGTTHGDDRIDLSALTLRHIKSVHGDFRNGDGDDVIIGNAQRNYIFGDGGSDTLRGGGGDDVLWGGVGRDLLTGGAGNDRLEGGGGNDTARFAGPADEYAISRSGDVIEVRDLNPGNGDEGTDHLRSVERAVFGDGTVIDLTKSTAGVFELASLNGRNGFAIEGAAFFDRSGYSVSDAGDINGDGIGDLVIGAPGWDFTAGRSYVVFGSTKPFDASLALTDLNGNNGFAINGANVNDYSGWSVSGGGDINDDGIDDLIIGGLGESPYDPTPTVGYVVFGSSHGFGPLLELSELDGDNGFAIDYFTADLPPIIWHVSGLGDINGDGIDDLAISTPDASPNGYDSGATYVIFGSSVGFDATVELGDLDGSNGFVINGAVAIDNSGSSVSGAGDINGDGIADLIIGATGLGPRSPYGGSYAYGGAYVVFGSATGFAPSLELSDIDGTNGFVIAGIASGGHCGSSVSGAGDVNGDGIDDLIIGAAYAGAGAAYVVFGSTAGFEPTFDLNTLDGANGFAVSGALDLERAGHSVSTAGDIDGDGLADIVIGAPGADPNGYGSGASYVVFGSDARFAAELNVADFDGSNGFVISGVERLDSSGWSVSGAGDVNGDGIDDLIIGAPFAGPKDEGGYSQAYGAAYIVFGSMTGFGASLDAAELLVSSQATAANDGWLM